MARLYVPNTSCFLSGIQTSTEAYDKVDYPRTFFHLRAEAEQLKDAHIKRDKSLSILKELFTPSSIAERDDRVRGCLLAYADYHP